MSHVPVLLNETITLLDPKPGEFFVDGTLGAGGHAEELIKKIMPNGKLLLIDWDKKNIEQVKAKIESHHSSFAHSIVVATRNFAHLPEILAEYELPKADGLLLDLGFSSDQMDTGGPAFAGDASARQGRGFSFQADEPLLMTYSDEETPVRDLLRELSEDDLRMVIRKYGEERFAGRIARLIKKELAKKPIETSKELADVVTRALPGNYERGRIHPATRTFMALRIYANQELENLLRVLEHLPDILAPGGRVGIISFHSLEDRMVKQHFAEYEKVGMLTRITKKPVTATREEIEKNSRARSAKLRVAQMSNW